MPKYAAITNYNSFLALPLMERPLARTILSSLRGKPETVRDYLKDPEFASDIAALQAADGVPIKPMAMAVAIGR